MSNLSDFLGGGKPKLITPYTSGTGTYIPTADKARCLVRMVGGGGGGFSSSTGGGGGAYIELWVRVPIAGWAYVVGGGGAVSANGTISSFGIYIAPAGKAALSSSIPGYGGMLGNQAGGVDADSVEVTASSPMFGVAGGAGGYSTGSTEGRLAGTPIPLNSTFATASVSSLMQGNGAGAGSGGDSFFGRGGAPGASPTAGNYGAGGGSNAAGLGGYIEIWDFGA